MLTLCPAALALLCVFATLELCESTSLIDDRA
jgi:hypothetical protein